MESIKRRRPRPQQPQSAEHDFYESLAQGQTNYYEAPADRNELEETPRILSPWAIMAIIVLGLLLILAIIVTFNYGITA